MSRQTIWQGGLILASLGALGLGARLLARPLVATTLPAAPSATAVAVATAAPVPGRVDSLAALAVARDPFRVSRAPAALAYDPQRGADPGVPTPPKPALVLRGIAWDDRNAPGAVVEGLPGIEGARVVRAGDAVGGLRVKKIERTRVVIVGLDTTWTLTVQEPWK